MNKQIGELIKEEMQQQGIKHQELAKRICVSRTNVYNILERNSIDTELLKRICKALNTNFFAVLADEMWKEGLPKPESAINDGQLSMVIQEEDMPYFNDKTLSEGFQEIKVLDIGLEINGVNFDERLELPQEAFPLLVYAYGCALEGPLRDMNDEQLDEEFFPWLLENHPRLAWLIKDAVEELLTERVAEDVDGIYRNDINYEEPTSIDDWFALGDNDIKYLLGNLTERIRNAKRPLTWVFPQIDF